MTRVSADSSTTAESDAGRRHPRSRLHPAKIRAGLRRRWFQHRMERTPLRETGGLELLGNPDYGGWIVPTALIEAGWVCYSVGAGGETSFDMELIERYGMIVRSIDPVAEYVKIAIEHAHGEPRLTAHQAAVATVDGPLRMQITHDPNSQSVSPAGLYDTRSYVELPGRTLPSLMVELGDSKIDLLKLDVEGGEYELIPTLDLKALGVKVFATQLHHTGSVGEARRLVVELAEQGYEAVACHPAVKLTFARRDLL
jgi:FkbM family methyltransferase